MKKQAALIMAIATTGFLAAMVMAKPTGPSGSGLIHLPKACAPVTLGMTWEEVTQWGFRGGTSAPVLMGPDDPDVSACLLFFRIDGAQDLHREPRVLQGILLAPVPAASQESTPPTDPKDRFWFMARRTSPEPVPAYHGSPRLILPPILGSLRFGMTQEQARFKLPFAPRLTKEGGADVWLLDQDREIDVYLFFQAGKLDSVLIQRKLPGKKR